MTAMGLFKTAVLVMLFYSVAINMVVYSLPSGSVRGVGDMFESDFDGETITEEVQENLDRQTNIPVVDIGALVFYSGNILIDLIANFATALPQMVGFLFAGLRNLLNLDGVIVLYAQGFATAIITVMYFIAVIQLLMGVRSGRSLE